MIKPFRIVGLLMAVSVMSLSIVLSTAGARVNAASSVKEYEAFHEVLHPLEHDALPKKDFARIRANAGELVTRGDAIVKLGAPAGTQNVEEFRKELNKFSEALKAFSGHARDGSDKQLADSFSEVHDRFEMLWGMVPR